MALIWEAQRDALLDICIVDSDTPSYTSQPVMSIGVCAEEDKSTCTRLTAKRSLAPQMNSFFKTLTERLAKRVFMGYGKVPLVKGPRPEIFILHNIILICLRKFSILTYSLIIVH